jgi:L-fuconate dehydratase
VLVSVDDQGALSPSGLCALALASLIALPPAATSRHNLIETIVALEALDIRFPTSAELDGSDAMNPDPDYSAAYVIVRTSEGAEGHGFTFTIGRGNELCVAAISAYAPLVVGRALDGILEEMGAFWRSLAGDSQLRWVGPDKGVVHLALAAVVNAVWDLWARREGKPVWRLVADMAPAEVVRLVDFRHITDALDGAEAIDIIARAHAGRVAMLATLQDRGYPAYTTSAGWLGYPEDKIRRLCRQAVAEGWQAIKIKVGRDLADDERRCAIVREEIGPDRLMMIDANQVWEVGEAITHVRALAQFDPWWIEEPVHPDDILGHAAVAAAVRPIRVATGEHCANRILFKQLLTADAVDVVQLDVCRLGGLNEALAVMLLAAKFGKPVCPHAGGVGLCELEQHVAVIDALWVSGSLEGRMCEHAGHLHEHFVDPIRIEAGRYRLPEVPGFSAEILPASRARFAFPGGAAWASF